MAIDPGTGRCGVVLYDAVAHALLRSEDLQPDALLASARRGGLQAEARFCAIELTLGAAARRVSGTGVATRDTSILIGRLLEAWFAHSWREPALVARQDVKHWLTGTPVATDADVARAVRTRFLPSGGGARPHYGTKREPGPLLGLSTHSTQALALAITYAERDLGLPRAPIVSDG